MYGGDFNKLPALLQLGETNNNDATPMMGREAARVRQAHNTSTTCTSSLAAHDLPQKTQNRTRRQLLRQSIALAGVVSLGCGLNSALINPVHAATSAANSTTDDTKRLRLVNVHTQEKISVVYWKDGDYQQESLNKINFLMRDFRANEVMYMDTDVIDYLYDVYRLTGSGEHIQILSGYRSPKTNEMLRKRSEGVAKNSLHIVGKAIDFRIPGQATRELRRQALSMKRGGIGYYKRSDFVHIDSGVFRHWE